MSKKKELSVEERISKLEKRRARARAKVKQLKGVRGPGHLLGDIIKLSKEIGRLKLGDRYEEDVPLYPSRGTPNYHMPFDPRE